VEIASFVLAVLGLVLAVVSLVWQFATFRLSGGNATALLKAGVLTNGMSILNAADKMTPDQLETTLQQHGGLPVIGVEVRSTGRMPVTVRSWGLRAPSGVVVNPISDQVGPSLKHTIDPYDSATWLTPFSNALAVASAERVLSPTLEVVQLVGVVELADGRVIVTGETIGFGS
jgi:hypothetical protein